VDDFVNEPHAAIRDLSEPGFAEHKDGSDGPSAKTPAESSATGGKPKYRQLTLNMVAAEAEANRRGSAALVAENPDWLVQEVERLTEGPTLFAPRQHFVLKTDVNMKRLRKIIVDAHSRHPEDFEALLGIRGVGPRTVRSLSLLAEVIFQAPPSHRDPAAPAVGGEKGVTDDRRWADYSYAHGGKDGIPYPVDRETYDHNIAVLEDAIRRARIGENDKFSALRRLASSEPRRRNSSD
jgi:hypothetical protein